MSHCFDCGASGKTFHDPSDGGVYCKECWEECYGQLPAEGGTTSSSSSSLINTKTVKHSGKHVMSRPESESKDSALFSFLPDDAPHGHVAHSKARYNGHHKNPLVSFRWKSTGQDVPFQTTVAAAGSCQAAEVIARACWMKFEQGWLKAEVLKFRDECYSKLRRALSSGLCARHIDADCPISSAVPALAKSQDVRHVTKHVDVPAQANSQDVRHVTKHADVLRGPARKSKTPEKLQLPPAKRIRTTPISSSSQAGWVSEKYLRCLLDDPAAPLPSQLWDTAVPPAEKHRPSSTPAPNPEICNPVGSFPGQTSFAVRAGPKLVAFRAVSALERGDAADLPFTEGPSSKHKVDACRPRSPSPESQHRECSQPTPQLEVPTPVLSRAEDSLPTPQLEIEEEPTPCVSLPTPQLEDALHFMSRRPRPQLRHELEVLVATPQLATAVPVQSDC